MAFFSKRNGYHFCYLELDELRKKKSVWETYQKDEGSDEFFRFMLLFFESELKAPFEMKLVTDVHVHVRVVANSNRFFSCVK